jgi:hypothetical protein
MTMGEHDIETRVAALEARVESLEGERPGRRRQPIVVSAEGVCGLDPQRDSATCPDASIYRRQKGCKGTACQQAASDYYANYRANGKRKTKTRK